MKSWENVYEYDLNEIYDRDLTINILSSIIAASGKKSKISVQYLQTFTEPYFLKHSS